jgi:UPF0176 protein
MQNNSLQVAAFYKFITLSELKNLQSSFYQFLSKQKIKGTILLASEGINGTVAGSKAAIEEFKKFLNKNNLLSLVTLRFQYQTKIPFQGLKLKLRMR